MNIWMSDPFPYPDRAARPRQGARRRRRSRGSASGAATRTWTATASRTARCRAPTCRPYFTRGSGHNEKGQYSERGDDYQHNMDRLARKFETAQDAGAAARDRRRADGARIGLIAYGTTHWAIVESRDQLRDEAGLATSYLRLQGVPVHRTRWPTSSTRHDRVYVVEQNRDAQMLALIRMELDPARAGQDPQRAALQRPADRRAQHHRRDPGAGRPGGRAHAAAERWRRCAARCRRRRRIGKRSASCELERHVDVAK